MGATSNGCVRVHVCVCVCVHVHVCVCACACVCVCEVGIAVSQRRIAEMLISRQEAVIPLEHGETTHKDGLP